ncbi:hypothetical protein NSTC731_00805 [Nostoc sp. DSM 114167]|jgi:hypothetical protein
MLSGGVVKNKVIVPTTACPFVSNTTYFVTNAYPLVTTLMRSLPIQPILLPMLIR